MEERICLLCANAKFVDKTEICRNTGQGLFCRLKKNFVLKFDSCGKFKEAEEETKRRKNKND